MKLNVVVSRQDWNFETRNVLRTKNDPIREHELNLQL